MADRQVSPAPGSTSRRLERRKGTHYLRNGGKIIEPDDGILAIGSGGSYALAAARMLIRHTDLSAREIVRESLETAAGICIYSNTHLTIVEL
jgi:ATP-dependent HslUV protease subunit HslV